MARVGDPGPEATYGWEWEYLTGQRQAEEWSLEDCRWVLERLRTGGRNGGRRSGEVRRAQGEVRQAEERQLRAILTREARRRGLSRAALEAAVLERWVRRQERKGA